MSKAKAVKGSKTKTTGAPTKPQNGPAGKTIL